MNLGTALGTLGERQTGTARLEEAVAAYRAALEERTRERVPLDWAMTQMNLGNALCALGNRRTGTAHLEAAAAAWDACLSVTSTVWPPDWVQVLEARCDEARGEIRRRADKQPRRPRRSGAAGNQPRKSGRPRVDSPAG